MLHKGNYDDYLVARERALQVKRAASARQEREVQRQMEFIDRFRSKARKASQVQSRLKQLEKMEIIKLPRATRKVHYSFPKPPRIGSEVITLTNVSKSYGDNVVYRGMNLTLSRGDRVALVGPNGAGKSTLLKILAGAIQIDKGERKTGHNVITTYYAQHVLELLNPKQYNHRGVAAVGANGIGAEPAHYSRRLPVQRRRCYVSLSPCCPAVKRPGWPWPNC